MKVYKFLAINNHQDTRFLTINRKYFNNTDMYKYKI